MVDVSIIIVSFNTRELLRKCVESIIDSVERHSMTQLRYEIVVVDNGSTDGSVRMIREMGEIGEIKIIENRENVGFGAGSNQGAKIAKGEYLLFLNSDCEVVGGAIKKLVEFARDQKDKGDKREIGVIGGKLLSPNGKIQPSTFNFFSLPMVFSMICELDRLWQVFPLRSLFFPTDKTYKTDWVSGACMLVHRIVWEKVGGFDEGIFMYAEEVDWQYRAHKLGYNSYYYPYAEFIHHVGGSSNLEFQVVGIYRGILYFFKKHKSVFELSIIRFMIKLKARLLILLGKIIHREYLVTTYEKVFNLV